MIQPITILGICGSLRQGSYNRALLRAASELLPDGVQLMTAEIGDLPLFNQDFEKDPPPIVQTFKQTVRAADAILFASPEYNYSIAGVLKNAIDWASRPYGDNSWEGKPVAIIGASSGLSGTMRAQYHLRQTFVFLDMRPINRPEVFVTNAAEHFDATGNLTDEKTRQKLEELLMALTVWTRQLSA